MGYKMKYIRYLLILIIVFFILLGGFKLLNTMGLLNEFDPTSISSGYIEYAFLCIFIAPLFSIVGKKSDVKLPKIRSIKNNELLLKCTLDINIKISKKDIIEYIKEAYECAFLSNRIIELVYEDDNYLEFIPKNKLELVKDKKYSNNGPIPSIISVDIIEKDNEHMVKIISKVINPFSLVTNRENKEHIKIVVNKLQENDIIKNSY
jgi:hypothetical protein